MIVLLLSLFEPCLNYTKGRASSPNPPPLERTAQIINAGTAAEGAEDRKSAIYPFTQL